MEPASPSACVSASLSLSRRGGAAAPRAPGSPGPCAPSRAARSILPPSPPGEAGSLLSKQPDTPYIQGRLRTGVLLQPRATAGQRGRPAGDQALPALRSPCCRSLWDEPQASTPGPQQPPTNPIFKCPDPKTGTNVDKFLQCSQCSGRRCDTVFFADCACIPRTRCRNGIQDRADWSDENLCE
ncbi:unnamed protein product [Nyctereutes procyonoides]|uniref:(raccoon dog) hypothetical protein n=1 Tax=Nyctereutes procyonoides TaxID=34880 RepID=A0A811YQ38_NYCPR|nr:unnamed protein product [Nyctereutes procyonoides]